jgi:hypothetical protein
MKIRDISRSPTCVTSLPALYKIDRRLLEKSSKITPCPSRCIIWTTTFAASVQPKADHALCLFRRLLLLDRACRVPNPSPARIRSRWVALSRSPREASQLSGRVDLGLSSRLFLPCPPAGMTRGRPSAGIRFDLAMHLGASRALCMGAFSMD